MAKASFFSLSYGLSGCYMPDSQYGAFKVTRRRDLVQAMRDAIEFYELPKSTLAQVSIKRLWSHARRHGLSVIHFQLTHKGNALAFFGLTRSEYEAIEASKDW